MLPATRANNPPGTDADAVKWAETKMWIQFV